MLWRLLAAIVSSSYLACGAQAPPILYIPSATISSSANPSAVSETVTLTATLTGAYGTPMGAVTFRDDTTSTTLCQSVPTVEGVASCSAAFAAIGTHTISAFFAPAGLVTYGPGLYFFSQKVVSGGTAQATVTLQSTPAASQAVGEPVTFTASATGSAGTPTGLVTFRDGSAVIGKLALSPSGQAAVTTSSLAEGAHTVTADYEGDAAYAATSASLSFTVEPRPRPSFGGLSTRTRVLVGEDITIAGFIIGGSTPKTVVISVAGPALASHGIPNSLVNPTLTLVSRGFVVTSNDDWQTQRNPADVAKIEASGLKPDYPQEPAIIATLPPGAYTAHVQGAGGATGVALVGVFEVDAVETPLVGISTRARVLTGDDIMIAGFVIKDDGPRTVVVSVAGPNLVNQGITNFLANPTLTLVSNGVVIATNDDWQVQANPAHVAQIEASGLKPSHPSEPAIIATLPPGSYTAIVQGAGGTTGVAVVGVFAVQ